ncbi:unnamed protein product [Strongylus vulgaris]|uniref:Uncharacterized protein n=1 Tax=Strongylus vulgaris TaxID=40348 RepID=A0A3P7KWQ9_STRVU|nr:unnamed protein product [Strongylus vulgaris]
MSTVHEQDELSRKIILPESYSYNGANGPLPSVPHRPLEDVTPQPPQEAKKNGMVSENDTRFGLLDNEDEERLLGDSQPVLSEDERQRMTAAGELYVNFFIVCTQLLPKFH